MKAIPIHAISENVSQLISEGNSVELRCLGSSMRPYLRGDGSEIIVVSPFSPDELIPGAIILFNYQGDLICHRIILCINESFMVQGDGTIVKRELITSAQVIGLVRTIIRRHQKPVSTQTKTARCYWFWWFRLSPIRRYLLWLYNLCN